MTAVATNNNITSMFHSLPKDLAGLSSEQLQHVITAVRLDDYKSQVTSHIKNSEFDLEEKINMWLEGKSHNTCRVYRLYLNNFVEYLEDIHVLDVSFKIVDQYIYAELNRYSCGKAGLILASLSSFYSSLLRWEYITRNPFTGCKLKKKISVPEIKHLPSETEMVCIYEKYNLFSKGNKKMQLALYIMKTYGVRVGFFNPELKYNGIHLSSISKGKYYKIYIENDEFIANNAELLSELNSSTIQSSFNRTINKLYDKGLINYKYSPHDLRHVFACKLYKETKDIYLVSRRLNHSSISITEAYLKGLKEE